MKSTPCLDYVIPVGGLQYKLIIVRMAFEKGELPESVLDLFQDYYTAYIGVKSGHPWHSMSYTDIENRSVGFTFSDDKIYNVSSAGDGWWFIGWDYASSSGWDRSGFEVFCDVESVLREAVNDNRKNQRSEQ